MGSSQSKKKWECTRYLNGNAPVASQVDGISGAPWPVCPTCGQRTTGAPTNGSNGTGSSSGKESNL